MRTFTAHGYRRSDAWHLAPLPPGVPYAQQQFAALMMENGGLDVDDSELAQLIRSIADE